MRKAWRRVSVVVGLASLAAAAALVVAGAATADHDYEGVATSHVFVDGNPRCPADVSHAGSLKIDGSKLDTSYNDGLIQITERGGDPDAFSWKLLDIHSVDVQAVIVKGGDGAYIYYYLSDDDDSDSGLTPPLNNGGQHPTISHVEFCFDAKNAPNPTLEVAKTASGTSRVQHTWAVDKQVKVAGAADSTYGDSASLSLPDGGSG